MRRFVSASVRHKTPCAFRLKEPNRTAVLSDVLCRSAVLPQASSPAFASALWLEPKLPTSCLARVPDRLVGLERSKPETQNAFHRFGTRPFDRASPHAFTYSIAHSDCRTLLPFAACPFRQDRAAAMGYLFSFHLAAPAHLAACQRKEKDTPTSFCNRHNSRAPAAPFDSQARRFRKR